MRVGSFSELEIRFIILQVLEGVDYLARKGVVHRDIKPENILLTIAPKVGHRVILSDFGISALPKRGRMMSEVGTDLYRAP